MSDPDQTASARDDPEAAPRDNLSTVQQYVGLGRDHMSVPAAELADPGPA